MPLSKKDLVVQKEVKSCTTCVEPQQSSTQGFFLRSAIAVLIVKVRL